MPGSAIWRATSLIRLAGLIRRSFLMAEKILVMRISLASLTLGWLVACATLILLCAPIEAQNYVLGDPTEDVSTNTSALEGQLSQNAALPRSSLGEMPGIPLPANGSHSYFSHDDLPASFPSSTVESNWLESVQVGYDGGFLIAAEKSLDLETADSPFLLRINGWGQLRQITFSSEGATADRNQFQLARARLILSGSAFTKDFDYYIQLDGRSSSGDNLRLLDYFLTYDIGHHKWGLKKGTLAFKTGKYKMPFHLARYLSARELEFCDRSMASTFFDVNRSLAWGLYGRTDRSRIPLSWETAIFNGLVTGGAETGSSGNLDNNFAYSARAYCYPIGDWGTEPLADFEGHCHLATRIGAGFANSTIDSSGSTEFGAIRVVDSGQTLASILPADANQYTVNLYSVDASMKYLGWSASFEYYFRQVGDIQGAAVPDLFDHGHWLQFGKFMVPEKFQLLARWSRVEGNSGTLGGANQQSEEISGGFVWYVRDQHAKFSVDATHLDGAPISSSALDIFPGDAGWQLRTQIQFAF